MLRNRSFSSRRNTTGRAYERYRPAVAIDVVAAKATDEPRTGRMRMRARRTASQTVSS
jgi:hypothetical protein